MKNWRLALAVTLLCLPAVLIIGICLWLVVRFVPDAIYYEPTRIGREYRQRAIELRENPNMATYTGVREKGWRQVGKIDGVPWGYVSRGGETIVWHAVGRRNCCAIRVKTIRPVPYAIFCYGGGSIVALALVGVSGFAVFWFLHFMRARDDFLAAVAHDLTTPLVGMRMMIGRNDEEAKRLNERMLLIVSNIKNFLRLGGRCRTSDAKVFDLVAACREAYGLFAADYEDSDGGAVSFEAPETLDVRADETMTMQILWNLFGNDLKYAAPYGKVTVRIRSAGDCAAVEFADVGPGMTPRQMKRAFDRYYRAKNALQTGKGGFGIGLCTSLEFARSMGGSLSVRANEPRGCVFTLVLPSPPRP